MIDYTKPLPNDLRELAHHLEEAMRERKGILFIAEHLINLGYKKVIYETPKTDRTDTNAG